MSVCSPGNLLLRSLPEAERAQLVPEFDRIEVRKGERLVEAGDRAEFAYFPEGGLSSNLTTANGTRRLEVGCFGYEAMINTATFLGAERMPHEILVQVGGPWLRIEASRLRSAFEVLPGLRQVLLQFAHVFIMTLSQTALSNGVCSIEERLARWLVMAQDRLRSDELALTHDFLGLMLGTQRSGVTLAIQALEGMGMIRARRGLITVLDRPRLITHAGDSYGPAEAEYERLIGPFRMHKATAPGS
ncbi:cyclic nucleotide-binding protein [Methylobacterium sp. Leaf104]|uniref:Crp/Fnr family transcriptional regulator n=1 Tax=Methylobacterium TaxID=407 RepID=UPI0006FA582E|nr:MULTISPECIES: Crp/Fnr family transcriptional regulator [Methylobacterium]KQP30818.1 cyclic nucleotide-binding protein [Methylobacterium sp. Leaf104]MCI9882189.1 Crp/Fnr family transcriptional regulator [Methylobacterium goesingense]